MIRSSLALVALLTPFALAACTSDTGSPPFDPLMLPECALDEVHVVGNVDGTDYDEHVVTSGHAFANQLGGSPGYLDVFDPMRRFMELQFEELIAANQTKAARGWVSLPDRALEFGNCEASGGLPSLIHQGPDTDTGGFVLRMVRQAPYCTAAPVLSGELRACWRFSPP